MLKLNRMPGVRRAAVVLPTMVLLGIGAVSAVTDDPEPVGVWIDDGRDPFARGAVLAVMGDGPDPISGVVRLPTPAEAINDNPDPFGAAIGDGPDPIDPIVICFMDDGVDCAYFGMPR